MLWPQLENHSELILFQTICIFRFSLSLSLSFWWKLKKQNGGGKLRKKALVKVNKVKCIRQTKYMAYVKPEHTHTHIHTESSTFKVQSSGSFFSLLAFDYARKKGIRFFLTNFNSFFVSAEKEHKLFGWFLRVFGGLSWTSCMNSAYVENTMIAICMSMYFCIQCPKCATLFFSSWFC